ncbi:MAG: penicillin-binding transpeptidase domain-containing protein, partial [Myxococcota bacterium]|nr:penicillin-binding transpeptidase domain-containing protein [Myxococcota bacterium]
PVSPVSPVSPAAPPGAAFDIARLRSALDLRSAVVENGRLVQRLVDGSVVEFSIDVEAQGAIQRLFDKYDVPVGAAVAIEVATGRVVLFASRARVPTERDPCVDASPPAASIFKIVTAAALLEDADIRADERVCYRGVSAVKQIRLGDLDEARLEIDTGTACATLARGMADSLNPVLGRLADAKLSPRTLLRRAERFVFGRAMPFDLPLDVSPVEIPQDRLEFARTAAGFWHVGLSPVHGAAIAQAIANGGRMLRPTLVDRVVGPNGADLYRAAPALLRTVVRPETAAALAAMMLGTVDVGTARKDFVDPEGRPFLTVPVAGKTGSLANPRPYAGYSWFVGFAPAAPAGSAVGDGEPVYAVAVLLINEERWRIKAALVAREALRALLAE